MPPARRWCIPYNRTSVTLRRVPASQHESAVGGIQTDRQRFIGIESPGPGAAGDELGWTRLGEVDGVVFVNELGGVRCASTIWHQGPCFGQGLGTVLGQADQNPFIAG